jgi:hypothetical protein
MLGVMMMINPPAAATARLGFALDPRFHRCQVFLNGDATATALVASVILLPFASFVPG